MKKAKTFQIRKITRKLKTETDETKKSKLEPQLAVTKALDHVKLGLALLNAALQSDELVWSRVKDVHVLAEESDNDLSWLVQEKQSLLKDIREFLAKLFHDNETKPAVVEEKDSVEPDVEPSLGKEDSYFVSSLNQNSKKTKMRDADLDEDEPVKKKRRTPRYDDSELEEDEPRKKKNRLGQRARRELWEQKYGDKAKHVRRAKAEKIKSKKHNLREYTAEQQKRELPQEKKAIASDLHPSWAAKLAQKQMASAGPSERIIFTED